MLDYFVYFFASVGFLGFASYLFPVIYQCLLLREQNLKEKYNASWALVTGASTGIGFAIAEKLASQSINVIMVALPDQHLNDAVYKLGKKYPDVKFVRVGLNLGVQDSAVFLNKIREATKDLEVRLVFNNAGYMLPGIFTNYSLENQLNNLNCNASAPVALTHEFARRMLGYERSSHGKRGLIAFTSSSAAFLPCPISSLYGSTKNFMTSFATAIGIELKEDGIDVVCVHPSPVKSNFFDNAKDISMLSAVQKTAVEAYVIADTIFKAAGKCLIRDQGYFSIGAKLFLKAVDWNFMTEVAPYFITSNPDFRRLKSSNKED